MKNSHRLRRFLEGAATAGLWGTCIFIGIVLAQRFFAVFDFARRSSWHHFVSSSISVYMAVPLCIALVFVLWRYFNIIQYRSGSRGSENVRFHRKKLWLYGLNKSSLYELQNTKNQTVLFDKKKSLIHLKGKQCNKGRGK